MKKTEQENRTIPTVNSALCICVLTFPAEMDQLSTNLSLSPHHLNRNVSMVSFDGLWSSHHTTIIHTCMHVYVRWMTPDVNLHHQLYAAKICLTQDQRERLFSNTVFFIQEMAAVRSCALCVYHTYSSNCGTFFGCLYHMCEVPLFCSLSPFRFLLLNIFDFHS